MGKVTLACGNVGFECGSVLFSRAYQSRREPVGGGEAGEGRARDCPFVIQLITS